MERGWKKLLQCTADEQNLSSPFTEHLLGGHEEGCQGRMKSGASKVLGSGWETHSCARSPSLIGITWTTRCSTARLSDSWRTAFCRASRLYRAILNCSQMLHAQQLLTWISRPEELLHILDNRSFVLDLYSMKFSLSKTSELIKMKNKTQKSPQNLS